MPPPPELSSAHGPLPSQSSQLPGMLPALATGQRCRLPWQRALADSAKCSPTSKEDQDERCEEAFQSLQFCDALFHNDYSWLPWTPRGIVAMKEITTALHPRSHSAAAPAARLAITWWALHATFLVVVVPVAPVITKFSVTLIPVARSISAAVAAARLAITWQVLHVILIAIT
jgi:hypothetical protein